jgi:hypothetical protein
MAADEPGGKPADPKPADAKPVEGATGWLGKMVAFLIASGIGGAVFGFATHEFDLYQARQDAKVAETEAERKATQAKAEAEALAAAAAEREAKAAIAGARLYAASLVQRDCDFIDETLRYFQVHDAVMKQNNLGLIAAEFADDRGTIAKFVAEQNDALPRNDSNDAAAALQDVNILQSATDILGDGLKRAASAFSNGQFSEQQRDEEVKGAANRAVAAYHQMEQLVDNPAKLTCIAGNGASGLGDRAASLAAIISPTQVAATVQNYFSQKLAENPAQLSPEVAKKLQDALKAAQETSVVTTPGVKNSLDHLQAQWGLQSQ